MTLVTRYSASCFWKARPAAPLVGTDGTTKNIYFQKNPQAMQQIAAQYLVKVIDFIIEMAKVTEVSLDKGKPSIRASGTSQQKSQPLKKTM